MPKNPGKNAVEQYAHWLDKALDIHDIEFLTLKGHVVIEGALKYLIATKLKADPVEFDATRINNFELLVTLAFAGEDDRTDGFVGGLKALNGARNKIAHWMNSGDFSPLLREFVRSTAEAVDIEMPWSEEPSVQLQAVRDALDRAAYRLFEMAVARQYEG